MPIELDTNEYGIFDDDIEVLMHLQNILLQALEGNRGHALDIEYQTFRRALLADPTYQDITPLLIRRHRDLQSLWPALKDISPQWEPRRQEVRSQFEPLLAEAERTELFGEVAIKDEIDAEIVKSSAYNSSAWTGAKTDSDRIAAVKTLMPVAQNAVDQLLGMLDEPGHNGGPLMDETEEAIGQLRQLHSALGTLLSAADEGRLKEAFNDGMALEAARYAKRAAKALRDDPIPYALSATILAILTACGLPGIGGFLSSVAITMKKQGD